MEDDATPIEIAERVADIARGLGIETIVIGAYALAAHRYVRATLDFDLATVTPIADLQRLEATLREHGFSTKLNWPDHVDPLGGKLVIWQRADEDGEPVEPVDVVNFLNPFAPRRTPAADAIRQALIVDDTKPALRYPRLEHLVALKLDAGSPKDLRDVVEVLAANPEADLDLVRATCKAHGLDVIDELIAEAQAQPPRR